MIIEKKISLSTSKEKVWKALFDDDYVQEYMGCRIRKINENQLEWFKKTNDFEQILLYGDIIEMTPYKFLKIKTFNPNRHYHSKFQLDLTYEILEKDHHTELKIIQSGFEKLPDGQVVFGENKEAWDKSLFKLKELFNHDR
ncbi:MAG: SRPBCC domain-containing protein [Candidatus Izemoplasmatales bacterium]